MQPLRFDDGDQGIIGGVEGRKVDCGGDEMGESLKRGKSGRWFVYDGLSAVFLK